MKLARCPVCHSNIHLDQLVQDDAGRQLLGIISKLGYRMGPALVAYLAMFRPAKQDLTNAKALALVTETLELSSNHAALSEALQDTVSSIQAGRIQGQVKQLTNHNYLKKVLHSKLNAMPAANKSTVEIRNSQPESQEDTLAAFNARMAQLGGRTVASDGK